MNKTAQRVLPTILLIAVVCGAGSATAHDGKPHGNHDSQHGGFVLMYEDLHFEVVALPGGTFQVYYSDAQRKQLPAAAVSDVALEVARAGSSPEFVAMAMTESGDGWSGKGQPVTDAKAIIRVAFVHKGKPVMVNVPAAALQPVRKATKVADSKGAMGQHAH